MTSDSRPLALSKLATGIQGFDLLSGGGLPSGRTSLLIGGAGTGKTVFAMHILANRLRDHGESSILVSFEEDVGNLIANAAGFGWTLRPASEAQSGEPGIYVLDAKLDPDVVQAGDFDLNGLIGALQALRKRTGSRIIVLDTIDWLIAMLDSPAAQRRELVRLREWLIQEDITALMTAMAEETYSGELDAALNYLPFMTECVISLHHEVTHRVASRQIRLVKYRGTTHSSNAFPMLVRSNGIAVLADPPELNHRSYTDRVSTGVERLDTMLGGGYYRATTILISGSPGTAKSTLSGAFTLAACQRGEKALYYSFDEAAEQILRNFKSVAIDLAPYIESGLLHMKGSRAFNVSAEEHFAQLRELIDEHKPGSVVIDPISAIGKISDQNESSTAIVNLLDYMKSQSITVLATTLLNPQHRDWESTQFNVSTIADTWMDVSFRINQGERNRALTIVKSRGMSHSNQVRELILSTTGISLADVYTAGGEVLMGTARMEREAEDKVQDAQRRAAYTHRRQELENQHQRLTLQMQMLQAEITQAAAEREQMLREESIWRDDQVRSTASIRSMRHADDSTEAGDRK
ncbi:MAG: circadian clock protein KaiC [Alphaproteobacteria bacterium]|nr:circadian clock protein KaiC [Alphaproteobacteria bacterium]MBU0796238.1 circadian clock protein KaiC [Alphaproteobacteria bacterium]MBU0885723.1 circadian clock protein KaiC [Alphaproteobacteria bacterium]MBU1813123.1 circadian clock protein KaiC [Alphaproteobacteria bacterium]